LGAAFAAALMALTPGAGVGAEKQGDDQANFAGLIKSAVTEKVAAELSAPGMDVESISVTVPDMRKATVDFDSTEVSIPSQSRRGDKIYVSITLLKNGKVVSRLSAVAAVKMTITAVVAARDIGRGAVLSAEDMTVEKVTAGAGFDRYVADSYKLVGKQLTRDLKAGSPIKMDSVSSRKMVTSGDTVLIVASSGTMRLSIPGKARQDGERGDWIKVVNMDSGKNISARVTGPGEVSVEF